MAGENQSSSSPASAGSPMAPTPSEVIVTPTWAAEMYAPRSSSMCSVSGAPRTPSSSIASRRWRRERTNEYSATTKNALNAIRTAVAKSARAVTLGARPARDYFGGCRRRSCRSTGGRYQRGYPERARPAPALELVDGRRELMVVLGHAALAVRRERQRDVVPAVDEDVGMVVSLLGEVRDAVHEPHRRLEVRELEVANQRVVLVSPLGVWHILVSCGS